MVCLRGLPRFVSGGLSVLVVLSLMNCTDRSPTVPGITAAAGGGGGGPTVSSTKPSDAPQDTTLDVVVAGSGFDRGSTAEWAIAGVPSSKVRTNSTRYVTSKQLVANITIALDADTVLYDVLVTTSRGKKGIGTELFRVRPKGPKPPPPPPDPLAPPGRIVFVRVLPAFNMEIFRMDATGANVVNLTNRASVQDYTPAWSPDGSKIVFACAVEICVMNDDGSGIVQLTTNLRAEAPAWSPDGSRIAFHREDPSGNWDIYVMDANGGNVVRLTTDPATEGYPDWSPDGAKIAFSRGISGTSQILVMNADGTGVVQLTTAASASNVPAWSPNGSRIAFARDHTGRDEIHVMNADGTGVTQVTTAGATKPDWSLDGTRIVFYATRSNNTDIYAINPDGTREVRLTSHNDTEHSPAWGPSRP